MRKNALLFIMCLSMSFLLTSCRMTHYTRGEAVKMIEELFPEEEISVSLFYKTEHEKGSFTRDHIWRCKFKDIPDLTFTISSVSGYTTEHSEYFLITDVNTVLLDYCWEKFQEEYASAVHYKPNGNSLTAQYSTKAELELLEAERIAFADWLVENDIPMEKDMPWRVDLSIVQVLNLPEDSYYASAIIPPNSLYTSPKIDESIFPRCELLLKAYYGYYALPNEVYSQDEMETFKKECWNWAKEDSVSIKKAINVETGEEIALEDFSGVGISSERISTGGLYEILIKRGFSVSGDSTEFSFTGADGSKYDFSYAWREKKTHFNEYKRYYLKDGEKKYSPFDASCDLLLGDKVMEDMTGIRFEIE